MNDRRPRRVREGEGERKVKDPDKVYMAHKTPTGFKSLLVTIAT